MRIVLRWFLFIVIVVCGGFAFYYLTTDRAEASRQKITSIEFHEPAKVALENKLESSRSFFQTAIAVGGLLLGIVFGKKDEILIVLGDWPEKLMFAVAFILLGISMLNGYYYTEEVTATCISATTAIEEPDKIGEKDKIYMIPNVFGPRQNSLFKLQVSFLVLGAVVSGLTFFSAHWLKGN